MDLRLRQGVRGACAAPRCVAPSQVVCVIENYLKARELGVRLEGLPGWLRGCHMSVVKQVTQCQCGGSVNIRVENERPVWSKTNTGSR